MSDDIVSSSNLRPHLLQAVLNVEDGTKRAEHVDIRESIREYHRMKVDTKLKKILEQTMRWQRRKEKQVVLKTKG